MKKKILSIFLTGVLCAGMLPMTAMAETVAGDYSTSYAAELTAEAPEIVYTDFISRATPTGSGTVENPYNYFKDALAAVAEGGTIMLGRNGGLIEAIHGQQGDMMPFIIDKAVTIKSESGSGLTVNPAGLILGADVTFENVKIGLANREKNAIFANGHTLTLKNAGKDSGTREVHLFAGGLIDAGERGESTAKSGAHGRICIEDSISSFGNIYAGAMNQASDLPATITMKDIGRREVGTIYASGALTGLYQGDDLLSGTEPESPVASAEYFPVNQSVSIMLNDANVTVIEGMASAVNQAKVEVSTTYLNENLALNDISALTVKSGNLKPKALNNGVDVSIHADGILDLSAVMENNRFTVGDFTGGGALWTGSEDTVAVNGVITGNTVFCVADEYMPVDGSTSSFVTPEHTYIVVPEDAGEHQFTFMAHIYDSVMRLLKEGNEWKAVEETVNMTQFDTTPVSVSCEESEITEVSEIYAEVPFEVDNQTIYPALELFAFSCTASFGGEVFDSEKNYLNGYDFEELNLSLIPDGRYQNEPRFYICRMYDDIELEAGVYVIQLTAPETAGGGTKTITLTVREEADAEPIEIMVMPRVIYRKAGSDEPVVELKIYGLPEGETVTIAPEPVLKVFGADGVTEITAEEALRMNGQHSIRWMNAAECEIDNTKYKMKKVDTMHFILTFWEAN